VLACATIEEEALMTGKYRRHHRTELAMLEDPDDPGNQIPLTEAEEEWARAAIERYLARARVAAGDPPDSPNPYPARDESA
jgi:hypothetical protein